VGCLLCLVPLLDAHRRIVAETTIVADVAPQRRARFRDKWAGGLRASDDHRFEAFGWFESCTVRGRPRRFGRDDSGRISDMTTTLSKEVALRIGLASRALPGVEVKRLLQLLHDRLGTLDEDGLTKITVTDLKTGLGSTDGEEDGEDLGPGLENLKRAVQILWGATPEEELPSLETPLSGGGASVRVAVASNASELLNGHFGTCLRFLVYDLSTTESRLVDVRSTTSADLTDDKNAARAELISDCQVLFVISIGGPAAAKVIRRGLYPMKRPEGGEARTILTELQHIMTNSPPPWLAKILGVRAEQRLKSYSAEADVRGQ